ncbi:MAG: SDR family NAD(P)-dependent oxidoreductase [Culicoidibacterales bacterium]
MKYTVITGASSGIGYATALEFAKRGSNLVITARRENELNELKKTILQINNELDVRIVTTDLSIPENVYAFYESLKDIEIATFINNAGFGNFQAISEQTLSKIQTMLHLNIEALTILSTLFVRDYEQVEGSVLINISSVGGYGIANGAITYCATKFYVAAFTEGLAQELQLRGAKLQAKVLAPAATETEFALRSRKGLESFDYNMLPKFNTAEEMATFLIKLHDSEKIVGLVDPQTYQFNIVDPMYPFVGSATFVEDEN